LECLRLFFLFALVPCYTPFVLDFVIQLLKLSSINLLSALAFFFELKISL
jgi:hypothetical protein